jgi:serine/threonine protein kinase/Tfp pilus assembly protein PilF
MSGSTHPDSEEFAERSSDPTESSGPGQTESIHQPSDPLVIARQHLKHPERIGPYRILEPIGEGAMGFVYLAEQQKPIHRRVALKVIKPGMDSRQVLARFETEREALALMNHPNVAKVLDAGVTEDGRPYFAMEHVAGVPITDYCDTLRLNTDERLGLFMDVCQAVQHAHQKGIIHRDIKPSNVLVAVQDDRPIVKVIDFGVAKATQHRLHERTHFTEQGMLLGTPGYMSPEQAAMTALDIDTRTDIYSLGVLLYELLVGSRPFDDRFLLEAGLAEIQRIICDVEPPKPSTRFSSLGADSTVVAHRRRTEPRTLSRELRGDLDWVVMKCLEKDRTRRYATANALALEVHRHLENEPVLAGPPARTYRLRKFLRRNRGPVAAVAALFLVLTAGLVASTWSYLRSEEQRHRADAEAVTAAQVKSFLVELFRLADPNEAQGQTITVREALDRGGARVIAELADQPPIQAALMQTIGNVYANLSLFDRARELLEGSLRVHQFSSADDALVADVLHDLAAVLYAQGDYERAEGLHRQALDLRRRRFGEQHEEVAESLADLATSLEMRGATEEAERLHQQALAMRQALFGAEHPAVSDSLISIARRAHLRDQLDVAEQSYQQAVRIREKTLGRQHPQTTEALHFLASVYRDQQKWEQAERLFRDILDRYRVVYDAQDPGIGGCLNNLGAVLSAQGRLDEAEPLLREALAISRQRLGPEHVQTSSDLNVLGGIVCRKGDFDEALALHRECLAIRRKVLGDEHEYTAVTHASLGRCLTKAGRYSEAEAELVEARRVFRTALGDRHRRTIDCLERFVELYEAWGRPDYAQEYRELLARLRPAPTPP